MSHSYFQEFVYGIAVDISLLTKTEVESLDKAPTVLSPEDPFTKL